MQKYFRMKFTQDRFGPGFRLAMQEAQRTVQLAALLLCAEEGKYITGIDLMVDGGMHL